MIGGLSPRDRGSMAGELRSEGTALEYKGLCSIGGGLQSPTCSGHRFYKGVHLKQIGDWAGAHQLGHGSCGRRYGTECGEAKWGHRAEGMLGGGVMRREEKRVR